jgi:hypothetical protein
MQQYHRIIEASNWKLQKDAPRNRPEPTYTLEHTGSMRVVNCKKEKSITYVGLIHKSGGSGEIRTHERLTPSAVFKTAAFNHSATLPVARHYT